MTLKLKQQNNLPPDRHSEVKDDVAKVFPSGLLTCFVYNQVS